MLFQVIMHTINLLILSDLKMQLFILTIPILLQLFARMKKITKMSESTVCILLAANLHI